MTVHPHFGFTKLGHAVHARTIDHHKGGRFNKTLAVAITKGVGSMPAAYVFCLLSLLSLPAVLAQALHVGWFPSWLVSVGLIALVAWIAQTFLQLVLLPVIIVGQNVQAEASDARAAKTFEDVTEILDKLDLRTQGGLSEVLKAVEHQKDEMAMLAAAVQAVLKARGEAPAAEPARERGSSGSAGTAGRKPVAERTAGTDWKKV